MLTENEFNISNLSYTQKDFNVIYPALLNLVKKISSKWDPTISNESDPGVILLKLNALIADKNNYNIDKNILETFPLSVTQEVNARQLYDQLGYRMRWYRAASVPVNFSWQGELTDGGEITSDTVISIPQFTMVCDDSNNVIFTVIDDGVSITPSSSVQTCIALQGVVDKLTVNGSALITSSNLDSNNRVYFTDYNVAENGIFIENNGEHNYTDWNRVDNIEVEDSGTKCYKFGVDPYQNSCYIEFPPDIDTIIKDGLTITYLKTDGEDGNIGSSVISKLYSEDVSNYLTNDNVKVSNFYATTDGKNPEDIDSAYRNYRKVVGTFETLVSLRDYINFIYESGYVSNVFVCDRKNDIQDSYHIVSTDGVDEENIVEVMHDSDGKDLMDAFSLKLYLLQYLDSTDSANAYDATFDLIHNFSSSKDSIIDSDIIRSIDEVKSIEHDFGLLREDAICLIKNKYPIICKIIPQYKMTDVEISDIVSNVYKTLYSNLNSRNVDFGNEPLYDVVYELIEKSDNRIKSVVLDSLDYKTYVVYFDSKTKSLREMCISVPDRNFIWGGEPGTSDNTGSWMRNGERFSDTNRVYVKGTNLLTHKDSEGNMVGLQAYDYVDGPMPWTENNYLEVKSSADINYSYAFNASLTDGEYGNYLPLIDTDNESGEPLGKYGDWFGINHRRSGGFVQFDLTGNGRVGEGRNRFYIEKVRIHTYFHQDGNYIHTPSRIDVALLDGTDIDENKLSYETIFSYTKENDRIVTTGNFTPSGSSGAKWIEYVLPTPKIASTARLKFTNGDNKWTMINEIELIGYPADDYTVENSRNEYDFDCYEYISSSNSFRLMGNINKLMNFQDEIVAKCTLAGITPMFKRDDRFSYSLNQQYKELISNVSTVSTNTVIELSASNNTYELRDNENVLLYTKSLVDKANYSTYVKYECNLNTSTSLINMNGLGSDSMRVEFKSLPSTNQAIPKNPPTVIGQLKDGEWYRVAFDGQEYDIQAKSGTVYIEGVGTTVVYLGYVAPYSYSNGGTFYGQYLGDYSSTFGIWSLGNLLYFNAKYSSSNFSHYFSLKKYDGYINTVIPANADYMLKPNQWIALYWKSAEDNTYYDYLMLGEGEIIKPNFSLRSNAAGTNAFDKLKGGWDMVGTRTGTTDDSNSLIYLVDGSQVTPTEFVTDLIDKSHVLSATASVVHRGVNEVQLSTDAHPRSDKQNISYCFWILNTPFMQGNKKYSRLFNDKDIVYNETVNSKGEVIRLGSAEYILQQGEYFLYTDVNMTNLNILGSGTSISLQDIVDFDSSLWTVPKIDYSAYISEGASAFEDVWKSILPFNGKVVVAETQFVTVGPKSQIRLMQDADNNSFSITLNSVDTVNLSDFNILYRAASDTNWTTLPRVILKNNEGWKARTLLSLSVDNKLEQPVLDRQSIVFKDSDGKPVGNTYLGEAIEPLPSIPTEVGFVPTYIEYIEDVNDDGKIDKEDLDSGTVKNIYTKSAFYNSDGEQVVVDSSPLYAYEYDSSSEHKMFSMSDNAKNSRMLYAQSVRSNSPKDYYLAVDKESVSEESNILDHITLLSRVTSPVEVVTLNKNSNSVLPYYKESVYNSVIGNTASDELLLYVFDNDNYKSKIYSVPMSEVGYSMTGITTQQRFDIPYYFKVRDGKLELNTSTIDGNFIGIIEEKVIDDEITISQDTVINGKTPEQKDSLPSTSGAKTGQVVIVNNYFYIFTSSGKWEMIAPEGKLTNVSFIATHTTDGETTRHHALYFVDNYGKVVKWGIKPDSSATSDIVGASSLKSGSIFGTTVTDDRSSVNKYFTYISDANGDDWIINVDTLSSPTGVCEFTSDNIGEFDDISNEFLTNVVKEEIDYECSLYEGVFVGVSTSSVPTDATNNIGIFYYDGTNSNKGYYGETHEIVAVGQVVKFGCSKLNSGVNAFNYHSGGMYCRYNGSGWEAVSPLYNFFTKEDYSAIIMGNLYEDMYKSGSINAEAYSDVEKMVVVKKTDGCMTSHFKFGVYSGRVSRIHMVKTPESTAPIYVTSDTAISVGGGQNQSVSTLNSSGTDIYPSFYVFEKSFNESYIDTVDGIGESNVPARMSFSTDGTIHVSLYDLDLQSTYDYHYGCFVRIKFKLPAGRYLLPIKNAIKNDGLDVFVRDSWNPYVEGNDTNIMRLTGVYPMHGDNVTDAEKVYYYDIVVPNIGLNDRDKTLFSVDVGFKSQSDFDVDNKDIVLLPIFKYEDNMYVEDGVNIERYISDYALPSSSRVRKKVRELDEDCVFNYTYVVSKDVLIDNPLDPHSFLITDHPYNKFTICQMSTYTSDISVTNKIKG